MSDNLMSLLTDDNGSKTSFQICFQFLIAFLPQDIVWIKRIGEENWCGLVRHKFRKYNKF